MNNTAQQIQDQTQLKQFVTHNQHQMEANTPFKVLACIDMDAFYAQAEARRFGLDDSVPVVVVQWRGCIAVSYAARKYGVTRLMSIEEIKKLCPEVVCIHVDTIKIGEPYINPYQRNLQEKYNIVRNRDREKVSLDYFRFESDKVISIFKKRCSIVEKASIDESFLDLTEEATEIYNKGNYKEEWAGQFAGGPSFVPQTKEDTLLMIGSQLIDQIRKEVLETLKYTCSAGISYNKMLSKLASGLNKPNNQTIIMQKYAEEALKPVSINKLRNFGGKIAEAFEGVGYKTLGDIQSLSLDEIERIVKDNHCARWVYFRCRGHDDELVEEKDFSNKSLLSNKSFDEKITNILDLENVFDLVLSDLCSRIVRFYNESKMVPGTLNLHYYDNSSHSRKTKSGPVNLKISQEKFFDALKAKTQELAKSVGSVLFPCKFLGVSARNFQKNDFKSYGFDLLTYAREKQKQKEAEKQKLFEKPKDINIDIHGEFDEINEKDIVSLNQRLDKSLDLEYFNHLNEPLSENRDRDQDFERILRQEMLGIDNYADVTSDKENYDDIMKEEVVEVEKVQCETCNLLIEKDKLQDHLDFHVAQNLDKELNPNKRKYRKVGDGQVAINFQESNEKFAKTTTTSSQASNPFSTNTKGKGQSLSSKDEKKSLDKNDKNKGAKKGGQTMSLDNFFMKK